jgi:acyl-CoA reductase-like NAD-dependent aldehyde dehydrogenase
MSTTAATSVRDPETLYARDPVTGEPLGSVAVTAPAAVAAVVGSVAAVQPLWGLLRVRDRARYLRRAAQALIDRRDELLESLAREQGRPRAEVAALELLPALARLRRIAESPPGWLAPSGGAAAPPFGSWAAGGFAGALRSRVSLTRVRFAAEPLGVVGVIGDGGAPFALPLCQLAAALLAGNGVVLKPAPRACLAAEEIAGLLARAGLPEGLVRVVHGGGATGAALARSPLDALTFTGSPAAAAEAVRARPSADTTVLHSGKTAMIVLADANLERAARCAASAASADAGQAFGALGRIYVARDAYEPFVERLVARVRALRVGDPRDRRVHVGPLACAAPLRALDELVSQALAEGARMLCGGALDPALLADAGAGAWRPAYYAPAVLADVGAPMAVLHQPVPGPLIAVIPTDSTEQALELASASEPGAVASVWSADRYRALRIARALRAHTVWLGDHPAGSRSLATGEPAGRGRAGGRRGPRGCAVARGPLAYARVTPIAEHLLGTGRIWWGPCDELHERAALTLLQARSARRADRERAWRRGAPALARLGARTLLLR